MLLRRLILGAITLVIAGCTGQPPVPSSPAERAANPESITRDNPGGDALNPTDAALERLLTAKLGRKIDKFETVEPAFSDWKNWKRVRYFGYPTRAGFRYGKDPAYAAAVLIYEEAEDDSPMTCIERFAGKAEKVAGLFDLELGPVEREMHTHRAGVEAVDWEAWEEDWKVREEERVEKLKKRLARQEELKKKRKLRFRVPRAIRAAPPTKLPTAKAITPADESAKNQAPEGEAAPAEDTATPPIPPAKVETPEEKKKREAAQRKAAIVRAGFLRRAKLAAQRRKERLEKMTPEERAELERKKEEFKKRRKERLQKMLQVRKTPMPKNLEPGDMPLIVTSGQFRTLFNRDRYLAGIVAYDSWPGTCLVQGFAVKVGSDEELAEQVLWRWIEEMAPILRWKRDLREAPEISNR